MNHSQKRKLARKMLTKKERDDGVNVFDSKFWDNKKEVARKKVKAHELKAKKIKK